MKFDMGDDGFPRLQELIKSYRIQSGLSQEALAQELGVSRGVVAHWETGVREPDSISRRRALAAILSIPPALLGLASFPEEKGIDMDLLKRLIQMEWTSYFASGNHGLSSAEQTQEKIFGFSKAQGHKNKELLQILANYTIFCLDVAREEDNVPAQKKHAKHAIQVATHLENDIILARALVSAAGASYHWDRYRSQAYATKALELKTPEALRAVALLDYGRSFGNIDAIEKALNLSTTDYPDVRFSQDFAYIRIAHVQHEQGKYDDAIDSLDLAKALMPPNLPRRNAMILSLAAKSQFKMKQYEDACFSATEATLIAQLIRSKPIIREMRELSSNLLVSPIGNTMGVRNLARKFTNI